MSGPRYDVIGDIHGQADELERLLRALDYRVQDGAFQSPNGHRAVFLGDFINRGPDTPRTLRVVRAMVERAGALAVMGNHEFNALAAAAEGVNAKSGEPSDRNLAFQQAPQEWANHLEWFKTLPLYLDLGGLRIVHAYWDDETRAALSGPRFTDDLLRPRGAFPNVRQAAADLLLRGPEIALPDSARALGSRKVRLKWWLQNCAPTFRAAGLSPTELPDLLLPPEAQRLMGSYPAAAPPLLFGHYGYPKPPLPFARNLACLDLAVARGGPLCAYRWNGEQELRPDHYLTVR